MFFILVWHFNLGGNRSHTLNPYEFYILSVPSMKHGRLEAHPPLSKSGLNWGSTYFCRKNDVICYVIERKVMSFFQQKKDQNKNCGAKLIFWSFATFFGLTIFWSGDNQRFCSSEINLFNNQSGILYLFIVHIMASGNFI